MRRAHSIRAYGLIALVLIAAQIARAGSPSTGGGTDAEPTPSLVTAFFAGEALLVDFESGQTTLSAPVGTMPMDVAIAPGSTPSEAFAYVPTGERQLVKVILDRSGTTPSLEVASVLDLSTAPIGGISPGPAIQPLVSLLYLPTDVALSGEGDRAWVPGLSAVVEVSLSGTGNDSVWIDLGPPVRPFAPHALRGVAPVAACAGAHGEVFIANFLSANVSRLGPSGFAEPVPLGDAHPIAIACDDQRVYVSSFSTGELFVIDQETGSVVTSIPYVGAGPVAAAFDPKRGQVYVGNFLDGTVTGIDTATLTITGRFRTTHLLTLRDILGITESELGERWARFVERRIHTRGAPQAQLHRLFGPHRPGGLEELLNDLLDGFLAAERIPASALIDVGTRAVAARDGEIHVANPRLGIVSLLELGTSAIPTLRVVPVPGGPNAVAILP